MLSYFLQGGETEIGVNIRRIYFRCLLKKVVINQYGQNSSCRNLIHENNLIKELKSDFDSDKLQTRTITFDMRCFVILMYMHMTKNERPLLYK